MSAANRSCGRVVGRMGDFNSMQVCLSADKRFEPASNLYIQNRSLAKLIRPIKPELSKCTSVCRVESYEIREVSKVSESLRPTVNPTLVERFNATRAATTTTCF